MSSSQRQRTTDKAEARRARAAAVRAEQEAAERRRRARTAALVAGFVVVLLVVLGVAWQASRTTEAESGAAPAGATDAGAFVLGAQDAPVTVSVYSDYLCPACRQFETVSGPVLDELVEAGTVRLEYHPISILDRASDDRYSTRSASAAACVAEADPAALRPFSEALFAEQPSEGGPGLSDDRLTEIASQAGVDVGPCIGETRYAGWVTRSTESASRSGVTGTPTVLVDGQRLQDWSPENLRAAVEQAAA